MTAILKVVDGTTSLILYHDPLSPLVLKNELAFPVYYALGDNSGCILHPYSIVEDAWDLSDCAEPIGMFTPLLT